MPPTANPRTGTEEMGDVSRWTQQTRRPCKEQFPAMENCGDPTGLRGSTGADWKKFGDHHCPLGSSLPIGLYADCDCYTYGNKRDDCSSSRTMYRNFRPCTPESIHVTSSLLARPSPGVSEMFRSNPSAYAQSEEPIQIGHAGLNPSERQRRIRVDECLFCVQRGHLCSVYPLCPKDRAHQ
ncbi:uncharacterized protein AB9W97_010293 isoform 1-T1 [Spinachia spinachia]